MADKKKKLVPTMLISEEGLKLYAPLSANVPVDKIIPFVVLAEPFYIEPILGNGVCFELREQIENNTLTPENKALLLKIWPAEALWTQYLAIRSLAYSTTAKGITAEASENSRSLSADELGDFRLDLKNQAELAQKMLIKYLCECQDLYPLWKASEDCHCNDYDNGDGSAEVPKDDFQIYLPNKVDKGCKTCNDSFVKKI